MNMTHRDERRGICQAGPRRPAARCAGGAARRARQGRLRRVEREVHAGAGRRRRRCAVGARAARWSASCARIPGIGNVTSTSSLVRPELIVRPDFARAADLGVTSAAIADTLRVATAGDYDQGPGQAQPVAAAGADRRAAAGRGARRTSTCSRGCRCRARAARCRWATWRPLPIDSGPAEIDRYDRLRNINFEVELNQQPLGQVEQTALALPSLKNLPPGVHPDVGRRCRGDERAVRELRAGDADRRRLHLHRAGAAVQGFRAAGDDPGRAGAVDSGRVPGAASSPTPRCRCRR